MATAVALPGLLATLTDALTSARSSFPTPIESLIPPADGISLLDTKNDLLLAYLHNLVFMIILKLRAQLNDGISDGNAQTIGNEAVQKLVETRAYLEKGVRPLEARLKYQIEKVLRAADDAERLNTQKNLTSRGQKRKPSTDAKGSGSSDTDTEEDSAEDTVTRDKPQVKIDDLSYRPNPQALIRQPDSSQIARSSSSDPRSTAAYKPPRITPTSMPDLLSTTSQSSRSDRRNRKSHLLDEYISTELSSAPAAEPSIGSNSTILRRGRGALSTRERDKERARTEYEESNLSRLPEESKAEKRKNKGRDSRRGGREEFGGEDWTGLGEVGDRLARNVGRGSGGGGREGKGSVMERREKRRRDESDGRIGGGVRIGDNFEKRRRIIEGRVERKRKSA